MGNTPTKKVENFLDSYKNQDEAVINQLQDMVNSDSLMTDDEKTTYSDIMKKQYEDMTYEIKDERIDGDNATVTVEIEVYDYYKASKEAEDYYNNNQDEFKTEGALAETSDNTVLDDVKNAAENVVEGAGEAVEDAADGAKNIIEGNPNDNTDASSGVLDDAKYVEYRINKLKEAKDRVTYTIDFTLTKVNDVWTLNDIDDITRQKIHGLYEH